MEAHDQSQRVARNLFDAIERVREDVAKVEFWAYVFAGFSEPVPGYDQTKMTGWVPKEQAARIERSDANAR